MAINGTGLVIAGVGAMFIYSGISGKGFLGTIQQVVQGKAPNLAATTNAIGGTSTVNTQDWPSPTNGQDDTSSGMAAMKLAAANRGWDTGAEWTALNAIEMQEAGYDPTNTNPSSGAYGLAQSLGHPYSGGPASNGVNEYGEEGLTPSMSEQASLGNPTYQAIWMMNYIAARYGDPIKAEQFHLQNNSY